MPATSTRSRCQRRVADARAARAGGTHRLCDFVCLRHIVCIGLYRACALTSDLFFWLTCTFITQDFSESSSILHKLLLLLLPLALVRHHGLAFFPLVHEINSKHRDRKRVTCEFRR